MLTESEIEKNKILGYGVWNPSILTIPRTQYRIKITRAMTGAQESRIKISLAAHKGRGYSLKDISEVQEVRR